MAFSVTPLEHLSFGAVVVGLSLRKALGDAAASAAVAEQLRRELDRHGLLVLHDADGGLEPKLHLALSELLGPVFPLPPRFQHARSPHHDILRVSNSEGEGFTGVGTTGWHIDGVSYATPFRYSLLHGVCAPARGPTLFLPLHPLAERICAHRPEWRRLWVRCGAGAGAVHHPLLYAHPRTGRPAVCLGKTSGIVWDMLPGPETLPERPAPCVADAGEAAVTRAQLAAHVESAAATLSYRHEWRTGDTVIVDNLAVAHLAPPETQEPPEAVGLRVLHRVVVAGDEPLRPALE